MATIHIARNGQSLGTFTETQIREGIKSGQFAAADLFWTEGAANWRPLGELAAQFDLQISAPPPLPPDFHTGKSLEIQASEFMEPAWERRSAIGFFPSFFQTIIGVLIRPSATFANLKRTGGFGEPLAFNLIIMATLFVLMFLLQWMFMGAIMKQVLSNPGSFMPQGAAPLPSTVTTQFPSFFGPTSWMLMGVGAIFNIIFGIGMMAAVLFILAGIHHLTLKLIGGAKQPYETTFRVYAYVQASTSILVYLLVDILILAFACLLRPGEIQHPQLGEGMLRLGIFVAVFLITYVIAIIWTFYCYIVGIKQAHGIEYWRATLGVLLPVILCCGSILLFYVCIAAAVAKFALSPH